MSAKTSVSSITLITVMLSEPLRITLHAPLLIRTRQSAHSDVNVQKGVVSSLLNSVLESHLIHSAVSY